jgi:hypothetical protein
MYVWASWSTDRGGLISDYLGACCMYLEEFGGVCCAGKRRGEILNRYFFQSFVCAQFEKLEQAANAQDVQWQIDTSRAGDRVSPDRRIASERWGELFGH